MTMKKTITFSLGIVGVLFFVLTTIIGGFLNPNYSHTQQFISELYAQNATNADALRFFGYLPSGILIFLFALLALKNTPKSSLNTLGFLGIGIGYGLGTVICSIFNCDTGCNPEFINPSLSQIIHNLSGFLTYCIVPFAILFIGIASNKWNNAKILTYISFALFIVSLSFVGMLNTNLQSPYKGIIQRVIEVSILVWIIIFSFYIYKQDAKNQ